MSEDKLWVNVNFDMRNQLKLFVGERSKTQFDSGCKMFDIFLKDTFRFDEIKFQNFYTGYITIKVKERFSKDTNNEWKLILKRYKLMANVHGETGANQIFTISKDMFLDKDVNNISQLRFILQQPSFYWKDFGIDDIKLKALNTDLSIEKVLEDFSKKSEKVKIKKIEKIPPIDVLSTRLQNLWILSNEASKQVKSKIEDNPRFDIDGCYDVNLLSVNHSQN
ncbi:unnamed protein product [Brachionus calyciflorus]|uniref:Uncharacterized protein n=1 Tax=Brachionus calyciflorus TaxID=104777 RepID=A0A814CZS3_9BILA|nr:unnamed protein product [Brachionus calyciflorus]